MDKLDTYRQVIQEIVKRYAKHKPSHGNIESIPICDTFQDNYLLMDLGWDDTGRVHSVILHLRIRDDKIWVEWDGTEQGIAEELLAAGIPKEEIVLGFYRPERRSLSGERCCLKVMMGLSARASTAINPKCTSIHKIQSWLAEAGEAIPSTDTGGRN